jgi:hypothetical protein
MLAKASSADEGRTASSEVHPSCREEIECVVGNGGGDALLSLVAGSVTCAGSPVRKRCCGKTKGWRATAKRAGEEVVVEEREDRVELSWTSLWSRSQRSSALRNPRREKVAAAAEHNTRALTCSCRTVVIDRCLHQRRCTTACHSRFEKHSCFLAFFEGNSLSFIFCAISSKKERRISSCQVAKAAMSRRKRGSVGPPPSFI